MRPARPILEILLVFARLSVTAFGGPAGHVALFREELVGRRRWLDDDAFLDLVALTNLLPGPNSTELAMEIGRRRGGRAGLVAAGAGFILPAGLVVLGVAALYTAYGEVPAIAAAFAGVMPIVLALLAVAIAALVRPILSRPALLTAAAICALAGLAGVHELALLAGGAVAGALLGGPSRAHGDARGALAVAGVPLLAAPPQLPVGDLAALFAVFLKTGALLFGSGYVLLAFLRADLVDRLGWLTERQLIDAIAIGQATPGPLFTTATFVGYALAGVPGAAVATLGIFLPAFVLVAVLGPRLPALAARPAVRSPLDGLRAASVGLIVAVTVTIAGTTLLRDGHIDPLATALAVGATVALLRGWVGPTVLVAAGALAGVARLALGA